MRQITSWAKLLIAVVVCLAIAAAVFLRHQLSTRPKSMSEILQAMTDAEQSGHYDEAIAVGKEWAQRFPQNGSNDQIFSKIAVLYLEKAKKDGAKTRESDVAQALEYRDKMLPIAADSGLGWYSLNALNDSALISEAAGDMSDTQRCTEYRNALKLLQRRGTSINEQHDRLSRRVGSKQDEFGHTAEDAQKLLQENAMTMDRIREKQRNTGCQP